MKRFLPILPVVLCVAAGRLAAQESAAPDDFAPEKSPAPETASAKMKYVLILPEEKTSEPVKGAERNPFGKIADDTKVINGKGTTEENAIRSKLEKLKIVGVAPGSKGLRVMLGNMLLEPDELVPPVIPDQTLRLRVAKITEQSIELAWVEKKPTGMPAPTLVLAWDIRPYVRYKLPGEMADKPAHEKSNSNKPVVMGTQLMPREGEEEAPVSPKISFATGAESKAGQDTRGKADANAPAPAPLTAPMPLASAPAATPAPSKADTAPSASHPQEPEEWKRAVGFLNDLVKLEDPKK